MIFNDWTYINFADKKFSSKKGECEMYFDDTRKNVRLRTDGGIYMIPVAIKQGKGGKKRSYKQQLIRVHKKYYEL